MEKTVTIPKAEYERLKRQSKVDTEFLENLAKSLSDIKEGKVRQVR